MSEEKIFMKKGIYKRLNLQVWVRLERFIPCDICSKNFIISSGLLAMDEVPIQISIAIFSR